MSHHVRPRQRRRPAPSQVARPTRADRARRLAPYCARSQSRARVLAYLRGLRSEAARKNSWHVADVCGESTPDGVQDLRSRADWDAAAVRDELRT